MTHTFSQILNEIQFTAARSRGPGGQNVNKVSSAAILTWNYSISPSINEEQRHLIQLKLANHISKIGILYLRSDEFRDFERNKSRCVEKLEKYLSMAWHKPKPRKKTKPTRASKLKRLDSKRRRSETKKLRRL